MNKYIDILKKTYHKNFWHVFELHCQIYPIQFHQTVRSTNTVSYSCWWKPWRRTIRKLKAYYIKVVVECTCTNFKHWLHLSYLWGWSFSHSVPSLHFSRALLKAKSWDLFNRAGARQNLLYPQRKFWWVLASTLSADRTWVWLQSGKLLMLLHV